MGASVGCFAALAIVSLLNFIPDFRAELIEHATNGDVIFPRWVA